MNRRAGDYEDDAFRGGFDWFKWVLLLMLGGGTASSGLSLYESRTDKGVDHSIYVTHEELQAVKELLETEIKYLAAEVDDQERDLEQAESRLGPSPELVRQVAAAFERIRQIEKRIDQAGIEDK